MAELNDELFTLAHSIVRGGNPSAQISKQYVAYDENVAIDIYRNNYLGNLLDALAGAYPVTKQLVGDDFFRFLARQFIEQYPSYSANLHHYGAELSDFVITFSPARELIYLADVATLEWACHVAYFAEDAENKLLEKLTQIPTEQYPNLIIQMHPACQIVNSAYPVCAIWRAHQLDTEDDLQIDLDSGSCCVLVSRKADRIELTELTDAEANWLIQIQSGACLGDATAKILESHADFDLQITLVKLATQNVLINVT